MDLISVNNFRRKRSLRYFALLFFFLMMCPSMVSAQNTVTIGGTVSSKGEPLIGAVVKEKGTTKATATNIDGVYSLTVQENAILEISYVGYKTKEIKVNGQKMIDIELEENVNMLDEVVAIGYGVQQKKLVTGATVQVKGDVIAQQNTVSPLSGLQGLTPGVSIVKNNGKPGEGFNVLIRGAGTMHDSEPLCIIDGQPGDLNALNPSDIETVDILKDAASAAIYGARAANGVILVTTKRAQKGKTNITYDGYVGIQNFRNNVETTGARDYLMLLQEAGLITEADLNTERVPMLDKINNGEWDGTNWLDEMTQKNAPIQNHAININKGSENSAFTMGFSYTSQKPTVAVPDDEVGSGFDRYTIRLNSEHTLIKLKDLDLLKVGETMTMVYSDKKGLDQATGQTTWNDFRNAFKTSPLFPAYDEATGEFADPVKINKDEFNPVAKMYYNSAMKQSKNYSLNGNFYLILEPLKNLRWRNNFGIRYSSWSYRGYVPAYNLNGSTEVKYRNTVTQQGGMGLGWQFESTLSYDFSINNQHKFSALLGTTIDKSGLGENYSGSNEDVEFDDFFHAYLGNAKTVEKGRTTLSGSAWGVSTLASFFGRINYGYKDKYLATFTLRADGSSKFASNNRWGFFPAGAFAWVPSSYEFMRENVSWLNFLKLRVSYGVVGNDRISSRRFPYLTLIKEENASNPWGGTGSLTEEQVGANNLMWEKAKKFDVGMDLHLFKDKFTLTLDYFKDTRDGIFQERKQIPDYVGLIQMPYGNIGRMKSWGADGNMEFYQQIGKDAHVILRSNFTLSKNKILNWEDTKKPYTYLENNGYANNVQRGFVAMGLFKDQQDVEMSPTQFGTVRPGDIKYRDINGDGKITDDDKVPLFAYSGVPQLMYGIGAEFRYKSWTLNVLFKGTGRNKFLYGGSDGKSFDGYMPFNQKDKGNIMTIAYNPENRWISAEYSGNQATENPNARFPRLYYGKNENNTKPSTFWMGDARYLRLQELSLAYNLKVPALQRILGINSMNIQLMCENLAVWDSVKIFDPEQATSCGQAYPLPARYSLQLYLNF